MFKISTEFLQCYLFYHVFTTIPTPKPSKLSEVATHGTITDLDLLTECDLLPNCESFPWNICNGCGMPNEDAYSSGHLVLSHLRSISPELVLFLDFRSFEHPSVLLLYCNNKRHVMHVLSLIYSVIDAERVR